MLCAVSVHGLPQRQRGDGAVYDVALDRIHAFARAEQIPLTLFAVGRDLSRDRSAVALRAVAQDGHSVENHSFDHRYDLTKLSRADQRLQIREGANAIEAVTGRRPQGFRAPGYIIDDGVLDALEAEDVAFDASAFPCPSYYLAKLGALAALAATGRRSAAIVASPWVMMAPTEPYRPGRPWHRPGSRGLWELPIAVTTTLRLPVIGTSLTMAGVTGARQLARGCIGRRLVSLELHGIDFLDVADGLDDLRGFQPDVELTVGHKQRSIGAALDVLRTAGYRFTSLSAAADIFSEGY